MTEERILIERNMELSAEFSRYLFEHPEVEEKLQFGAEVVLLPEKELPFLGSEEVEKPFPLCPP